MNCSYASFRHLVENDKSALPCFATPVAIIMLPDRGTIALVCRDHGRQIADPAKRAVFGSVIVMEGSLD